MNKKNIFLIVLYVLNTSSILPKNNKIKIVLTAAITDKHFEERKQEYITSINKTKVIASQLGYEIYIIESCKDSPTFLDKYCSNVFYAKVNPPHLNPKIHNKGVYEAKALLKGLEHFKFNDDDIIIKLTGRYYFADNFFIKLVESYSHYDAIVRKWLSPGTLYTGCYAIKCKYLKKMIKNINFDNMQKKWISLETEFTSYIYNLKDKKGKIGYVDEVHVFSSIYGYGQLDVYKPNNFVYW